MGAAMRRRRYFVHRGFQGRFVAAFVVLALAGGVATALASARASHRALGEAMFRAHLAERSTVDILLPVVVPVNLVGAAVVALVGIGAAAVLFRRQARALDQLCGQLAAWTRSIRSGERPPSPAMEGWAGEIERAVIAADRALRSTYQDAAARARELLAAARRLESEPEQDRAEVNEQLEAIAELLAANRSGAEDG